VSDSRRNPGLAPEPARTSGSGTVPVNPVNPCSGAHSFGECTHGLVLRLMPKSGSAKAAKETLLQYQYSLHETIPPIFILSYRPFVFPLSSPVPILEIDYKSYKAY